MKSSLKLSIIIPIFNEENTIHAIIRKVREVNIERVLNREIIIIDDGSTDKTGSILKEYEISKTKFEKLKKKVILHNKTYSLNKLINKIPKFKKDTSWGFPKGRKMKNEINLHCAMREFEEETNYKRYDYKILNDIILKETIVGVNGITYQHYYYLAEDLSNNEPYLDEKNLNQITEIKDIKFFSYNKCYKLFNNIEIPKLTVLIKAQNLIQKLNK